MSEQASPNLPANEQERLMRQRIGWRVLEDERLIWVKGEDRHSWLQGQITNDIRKLDGKMPLDACMCSPTGQLIAILRIWNVLDSLLLATHKDSVDAVLQRFDQMVIMEDVEASVNETTRILSLQGPAARQYFDMRWRALESDRFGLGGMDQLLTDGKVQGFHEELRAFEETWNAIRLAAGVPHFGVDTNSKTLPPELGPAFIAKHISYHKGCYTGQEVLARIESRGHTNQTWRAIICQRSLVAGETMSHPNREQAGVVTSTGWLPSLGFFAGAMLRNEVRVGDQVMLKDGAAAIVKDFPIL